MEIRAGGKVESGNVVMQRFFHCTDLAVCVRVQELKSEKNSAWHVPLHFEHLMIVIDLGLKQETSKHPF